MSLEDSRRSQRPYRYGMVLLCVGALINWLGLAENYVEPVRYVGVACIIAGALLICAAMCCWLHAPPSRATMHTQHTNHPITAQVSRHFILIQRYKRLAKNCLFSLCVSALSYDVTEETLLHTFAITAFDDRAKLRKRGILCASLLLEQFLMNLERGMISRMGESSSS